MLGTQKSLSGKKEDIDTARIQKERDRQEKDQK
jgi:hypothetical protein